MAEQNNQAERAAFEAHAESRGLTLTRAKIGSGYYLSDTNEAWKAWLAARAALAAAVDAEGLPEARTVMQLADEFGSGSTAYTAEQVQQIIAADRRKQAALTQMIELGHEIEASGERQSIDTPELKRLLIEWHRAASGDPSIAMYNQIVAYIDGRTAGAAVPADPMDWPIPCDVKVGGVNIRQGCKLRTLVARMESLHRMAVAALPKVTPEQRAEFEALFAAPSHQSPGKEGV